MCVVGTKLVYKSFGKDQNIDERIKADNNCIIRFFSFAVNNVQVVVCILLRAAIDNGISVAIPL